MAGNRAPSLILHYHEKSSSDIVVQEVCVPQSGSVKCTYYCCICWNAGKNGSGYCGIQDHPDGKCYIFSIWDPHNSSEPIKAVYKGPGTWAQRFDGEGTGLKSMNFDLGWETDQWYTAVIRRWDHEGHTRFGFWIHDQTSEKWTHLITMDFPEAGYFFNHVSSFLEDWHGNGHSIRCVKYKNGLKRKCDFSWCRLRSASFYANQEDACKNYNDNFNASVNSECYFLQSGYMTCPEEGLGPSKDLFCDCQDGPCTVSPSQATTQFTIELLTRSQITWHVRQRETPQFKYTVKDGDKILASDVDSEARTCHVDLSHVSNVTLALEDILGRETSLTMGLTSKPKGCTS
ncbi:uncharacterized protein LOC135482038 [Liolophura sinensis]|uniref:uncharacterized protein LOC135482038 n=1 Tax=Liolophura sinensis TaxID=3198878 RepID=UPI003159483A